MSEQIVIEANGVRIPALGFGTWQLRDEACVSAVETALACGYRHIDTARMYANEKPVGQGLRASGLKRDAVFVTTKVWREEIGAGALERSAEASLRDLGLDQVDLLLIHWPNGEVPLAATMRALNDVRRKGLTAHIGVSNFPTAVMAEAIAASEAPLVANQVEYHPYLDQTKLLGQCRENGIAFVAYCPLYRSGGLLEEAPIRDAAERHGKSPAQIVLRWHVQQDGIVAIPRTSRPERLSENAAIFDFWLSDAEMSAISGLRRPVRRLAENESPLPPSWDE